MEIEIENPDYYEYGVEKQRTKKRLTELKQKGFTVVGYGEFGIKNKMSGLYIERVWRYSDEQWQEYVDWAVSVKEK